MTDDHVNIAKLYRARNLDELREAYDDWADTYDQQIMGDYGWVGHEMILDRVRPLLADDALILDAGAGSGAVGLVARAAGFTTIDAMDLSTRMLDIAKGHGVYREVHAAVLGEPLDYETDRYDAVLSAGVFTPGHAPPESFDELVRIVKPGGYICFTLRDDETPPGFVEVFDRLSDTGQWALIAKDDPFQSMPNGEPDVWHRVWLFRVTKTKS